MQFWADHAIGELLAKVADSPFASLCKEIAALIHKAGDKGITEAELTHKSAKFAGADKKNQRSNVFRWRGVGSWQPSGLCAFAKWVRKAAHCQCEGCRFQWNGLIAIIRTPPCQEGQDEINNKGGYLCFICVNTLETRMDTGFPVAMMIVEYRP